MVNHQLPALQSLDQHPGDSSHKGGDGSVVAGPRRYQTVCHQQYELPESNSRKGTLGPGEFSNLFVGDDCHCVYVKGVSAKDAEQKRLIQLYNVICLVI